MLIIEIMCVRQNAQLEGYSFVHYFKHFVLDISGTLRYTKSVPRNSTSDPDGASPKKAQKILKKI